MKCSICNKELQLTDTFCPVCGFLNLILPKEGSAFVEDYKKNRIENYKKIWETLNKSQALSQEYENKNIALQHALDDMQQQLDKKICQNNNLSHQLSAIQLDLSQLNSDLEKQQKCFEESQRVALRLEKENALLHHKLDELVISEEALDESNNELSSEVNNLREINKSLNLLLNEKQNTILYLEKTKQEDDVEFLEQKKLYEEAVMKVNDLYSSIAVLNNQLNEKQNMVVQTQQSLTDAKSHIKALENEREQLLSQLRHDSKKAQTINNEKKETKDNATTKICKECGLLYPAYSKFCKRCGSKLY